MARSVYTLYPGPFYSVEGAMPTRYYLFNGQPLAIRIGANTVTYLIRDQVGSVVEREDQAVVRQDRQYYPYGNKRSGDDFSFEPNYTGQRLDESGLLYYHARYYDPKLGQFLSPDTVNPDRSDYFSYKPYLYTRGNPLSNNDPSGNDWNVP